MFQGCFRYRHSQDRRRNHQGRQRAAWSRHEHGTFHSHETAGVSIQQYVTAIEAGATQVDLSMSPVSGGTCQPDIMTMWHALRGTDYDLGIDPDAIMEVEEVFKECMEDYFLPPEATMVNPIIPFSPLPGGALTANTQMLRDNGLMDKYHDITKAMGEVVMKGGYGTSVTPVSQFYFQQAFNNVMFGPWKKIADGYGKMVLGYFGKTLLLNPMRRSRQSVRNRWDWNPLPKRLWTSTTRTLKNSVLKPPRRCLPTTVSPT